MKSQPMDGNARLNVANCLSILHSRRFEVTSGVKDLRSSVEFLQQELSGAPDPGERTRLSVTSTLGSLYHQLFEGTGSIEHLDNAILSLRKVLASVIHDPSQSAPIYSNLGRCFVERFERTGDSENIEQAVAFAKAALDVTPKNDLTRLSHLINLGVALRRKFEFTRSMEDLAGAVESLKLAAQDVPPDQHGRVFILSKLGDFLFYQYKYTGATDTVASAIRATAEAKSLTPLDHPDYSKRVEALEQMQQQSDDAEGDEAMTMQSVADTGFSQANESARSSESLGVPLDQDAESKGSIPHDENITNTGPWLEEFDFAPEKVMSTGSDTTPASGQDISTPSSAALYTTRYTTPLERLGARESPLRGCSPPPPSSSGSSTCITEDFETLPTVEELAFPSHSGTEEESEIELMRFSQPEKWLSGLKSLMKDVTDNSSLNRSLHPMSEMFEIHMQGNLVLRTPFNYDVDAPKEHAQLEALMQGVSENLERMQAAKYCTDSINFLLLHPSRPCVARLVSARIDEIQSLFSKILEAQWANDAELASLCLGFLSSLENSLGDAIRTGIEISSIRSSPAPVSNHKAHIGIILARITIQILDVTIASFSGVHIEPLLVEQDRETSHIPIAPGLHLRQKDLRCLSKYLEKPVWVVEIHINTEFMTAPESLYLSTTIQDFASIWGPVWPVCDRDAGVVWYNVGLGSIVRWQRADDEPETAEDEVFCHWARHCDLVRDEDCAIPQNGQRLLIGGMRHNRKCGNEYRYFNSRKRLGNSTKQLGTESRSLCLDSITGSAVLGGGALGPSVGGALAHKMQGKLIVRRWRVPSPATM